jgi:hypothetical protein
MEGIISMEELLKRVEEIENPLEALMRAFNLVCPF